MKIFKFWRYPKYLQLIWWQHLTPLIVKSHGVLLFGKVIFHGMPIISLTYNSKIEIGSNSILCSNSEMTALGVNHPVVLRTLKDGASIVIGKNTGISGATICAVEHVQIGDECLIGANAVIVDTDFHSISPDNRRFQKDWGEIQSKPTIIENNVFIGAGAYILKGVRIGKNSVIGANSVVTKSIPENSIAAGNPAKIVRLLTNN